MAVSYEIPLTPNALILSGGPSVPEAGLEPRRHYNHRRVPGGVLEGRLSNPISANVRRGHLSLMTPRGGRPYEQQQEQGFSGTNRFVISTTIYSVNWEKSKDKELSRGTVVASRLSIHSNSFCSSSAVGVPATSNVLLVGSHISSRSEQLTVDLVVGYKRIYVEDVPESLKTQQYKRLLELSADFGTWQHPDELRSAIYEVLWKPVCDWIERGWDSCLSASYTIFRN